MITRNLSAKRKRRSRGFATLTELGLCFLVFLCIIFGAFDFGQFLFIHAALTERARYAARWGAINDPSNTTAVVNKVLYDQATDPGTGVTYFDMTTSNVTAAYTGAGTDNAALTVTIAGYQYKMLSPYIAGTKTSPTIEVVIPVGRFD